MSYQQVSTCDITESDLTEALVPVYLSSLRWTSDYDSELTARGKPVKHGQAIGGEKFSAVISKDCNDILVQYGRRVVIRQTSSLQLRLDCHHHSHVRKTRHDDALSEQATNDKNAQALADILTDEAKRNAAKKQKATWKKNSQSTNQNVQATNQPAPQKTRKSVSKQTGCGYTLTFVCELNEVRNPKSSRVWRLKAIHDSESADVNGDESIVYCGHSCSPDLTLQVGGVLYLAQLTKPMLDFLAEMTTTKTPSELRLRLQRKFDKRFIDFGLIRTALEKLNPTRGQARAPEVHDLIEYLEAHKDIFTSRSQYHPTVINGQRVRELRNVFFATKQMIRLLKEYGQFLIIDATYNITNFTMKLFVFTIRTAAGTFSIAAVALITEESEAHIRWAMLELMQQAELTPGDVNGMVKCVMTDGARAYLKVIKDLTPSADHQLCVWHQGEIMCTFAKQWAEDGEAAANAMVEILRESDSLTAEKKWFAMMETHFNHSNRLQDQPHSDSETDAMKKMCEDGNKKRQNARALLQVWYAKRCKFWKAGTKHFMNIGAVSSQGSEVMNNAMKPTKTALTLVELIEMTEVVSDRHI